MRAVSILTDPRAGVRLKGSSVTVSTVGIVPEIERFCTDPANRASLAISLHTVSGSVRDQVSFRGFIRYGVWRVVGDSVLSFEGVGKSRTERDAWIAKRETLVG